MLPRCPIFVYEDKEQSEHTEIKNMLGKIRNQLIMLRNQPLSNTSDKVYPLSNLMQLQDLILERLEKGQSIDQYLNETKQITQLYVCHMLSIQLNPINQTQDLLENPHQKLQKTKLFNFPAVCYSQSFSQLVRKLYMEEKQLLVTIQNLKIYQNGLINICKQKLVNDSCVGCNSWFYKYHPIESIFDQKMIPIYFMYNQSKQLIALKQKELIKLPSHELLIDIQEMLSYRMIILNKILDILNRGGGYLLIGCQKMQFIVDNKILPYQSLFHSPQLNQIHFVIGQIMVQSQKNQFEERMQDIIKYICPLVSLNQQIEIRYLPVINSEYNHGACLKQIYKPVVQNRNVILIAIKPNSKLLSKKYFLNNHLRQQQSQPVLNLQQNNLIQSIRLNQTYESQELQQQDQRQFDYGRQFFQVYNQSRPVQTQSPQIQDFFGMDAQQLFDKQAYFDKHPCQYDQQ